MEILNLARGATAIRRSRTGPTLHVINHAAIDYAAQSGLTGGYLAIGFDMSPTLSANDGMVPPFCEALIYVPPSVTTVYLAFPNERGAQVTFASGPTVSEPNSLHFGLEFLPICVPTTVRAFHPGAAPVLATQNPPTNPHTLAIVSDMPGLSWYPSDTLPVYDQGQRQAAGAQHLRPHIAPSITTTQRVAAAANTLFDFGDSGWGWPWSFGIGPVKWSVVQRAIVTASVAGLFVFGGQSLTVGSPGVAEAARATLAAGVPFTFEFGEGLETNSVNSNSGQWRAYFSAIATLDITVIGG